MSRQARAAEQPCNGHLVRRERYRREFEEHKRDRRARGILLDAEFANQSYEAEIEWVNAAPDPDERVRRETERKARTEGPRSISLGGAGRDLDWLDLVGDLGNEAAGAPEASITDEQSVTSGSELAVASAVTSQDETASSLTDLSHSRVAEGAACDKLVKRRRVPNRFRDASYLFRRTAIFLSDAMLPVTDKRRQSLVPFVPINIASSTTYEMPGLFEEEIRALHGPRRFRPWWERFCQVGVSRAYRAPAPYRDVSDPLRLVYLAEALTEAGDWHGFTLRLNDKVQAEAKAQANPSDWLFRRLRRAIKNELSQDVPFFMVVEEDDNPRKDLHLHGGVGLGKKDFDRVRPAMKRAAGLWLIKPKSAPAAVEATEDGELEMDREKARANPRQLRASLNPNTEWASYCAKDLQKSSPMALQLGRRTSSVHAFDGWPLRVTRELSSRAAELYVLDRELVMAAGEFILR